ncbi:S41 family peptidase [Dokdonella ginsengisoli]|uniref:Tricorn protease homolog n=1 Tax=Dokdonella ginsengisoli TaxID=363846 RepID=A0ABV9QQR6_9GAMM
MSARRPLSLAILASLFLSPAAFAGTKLLRFPDVCGDKVVFTYAGDLWTASTQGGTAVRLTAGPGLEQSARFSPDCSTVAFTGQYGGDDQVYTIAAGGGEPKQLTFYPAKGPLPQRWGFDNQVYGWTPDGKSVLFRSWEQSISESNPRLYTVPAEGGLPTALPMPVAGVGRYSPDGSKIVYSPKYRDFRTWNRYVGGWAQDLYVYDFAAKSAKNITNDPNTDRDPVWIGDAVYFIADRGAHLNLYRYDTASGDTKQLTDYQGADARWASGDTKGRIVFEVDGELHLYDTQSSKDQALDITVPSDLVRTRAQERSVKDKIEDYALSANGKRALFTARGEVFSVPIKDGITLNLTHTPGAHEREAEWSHDGRRIVYVSDQSGEDAIWVRDADGGNAKPLTSETFGRLYAPRWSPDGSRIAFVDSNNNLRIVAASGGPAPVVAHELAYPRRDHVWSPGGHYLAFSLTDKDDIKPRLHVYDLAAGKSVRVGDARFDSYSPSFSPDGQYLYFLGNREWAPQLSNIEWNFAGNRSTGLYALALRKGVGNPFAPRNDSAAAEDKKDGDADKKDEAKPKAAADVNDRIEFEGLDARLTRAPIDPDNIDGFEVTRKAILYVVSDGQYYGRDGAFKTKLKAWSFEQRKSEDVFEGVDGLSISRDGSTALVKSDGAYKVIDLDAGKPEPKDVKTDGLFALVDPKAEYAEIFRETWRRYRDHFYVQNMHGYDWPAIRAKYEPMLAWVGDRSDLNYLLGQMVAELNVGHAYVSGGDLGLPAKPYVGLLGARFELDAASGQYRIARILQGQNDEERYRSPLTELGVDVKEGDYVVAINGQPLTRNDSPYRLLRTAPGQLIQLTVNGKPGSDGARTVLVRPIDSEEPLNYYAWVAHNREYVAKASNGEMGYLHIPDMGPDGIREFIKWYYPQLRKQGLVVDVRDNGGGNVSAMVIERLSRKVLGLDYGRNVDFTGTYPNETFLGHLVALCNGTTASDGDIFSHMFKQAKLGPLIGVRTWGGVVGITGWGPAIDGGEIFVPQFASASPEGQYVVEGHGVDPDIVVEQDVAAQLEGKDPQLDRGIEELRKAIQAAPVKLPGRPADPVKAPDNMRAKGAPGT